ncbi:hypothetical protein BOTBODRAFT_59389 [Botryobasidium botryosum FD-172 SS1]|uniref:Uncharacterized protein n=1 Tax=Botryobasidium botryosum (strain FD-172 SS1) TaxID=930990 RepID=A0A067M0U7_BOTB1|nr:hypothetical protein BOTBODRAFT_59389 [Botryobasidium botryosum FD-172 SS1]
MATSQPSSLRLYCVYIDPAEEDVSRVDIAPGSDLIDLVPLIHRSRETLKLKQIDIGACYKLDPPIPVVNNDYRKHIRKIVEHEPEPKPMIMIEPSVPIGEYFSQPPELRHMHILVLPRSCFGPPPASSRLDPPPASSRPDPPPASLNSHGVVQVETMPDWAPANWSALWGKPEQIATDGSILSPRFDLLYSVYIREEYKRAWEYIENQLELRKSAVGEQIGGLVLWGHPGIGKTSFLYFALAKALVAKRPVAFCFRGASSLLFTQAGVEILLDTYDESRLPQGVLALCDSNSGLFTPPMLFSSKTSPAFVVQAASPQVSRWRGWSKQKDGLVWTMAIWQRQEILEASTHIQRDPDYYSPVELFDLLGPSARNCMQKTAQGIRKTGNPETDMMEYLELAPDVLLQAQVDLVRVLGGADVASILQMEAFHNFFFAMPRALRTRRLSKGPSINYVIPTPLLRKLFSRTMRAWDYDDQLDFLRKLRPFPQVAGLAYEALAVRALSGLAVPLVCALACGTSFTIPRLTVAPFPEDFTTPFLPDNNTLYVPPAGFETIDAIAVTENASRITLLQMTIAKTHTIKPGKIRKVLDCFTSAMPGTTLNSTLIFIAPSKTRGEGLSARGSFKFGRATSRNPSGARSIDIGWALIPITANPRDFAIMEELDGDELEFDLSDDEMDLDV